MPGLDALAVGPYNGQGVTDPRDARHASGGLLALQGPTALDVRTGVLAGPGTTQLITGTSKTGPKMSVLIGAHVAVTTRGTANGAYLGPTLDAATEVDVDLAPATGSRIDVVYVKQRDTTSNVPTPDPSPGVDYKVLTGTPSTGTPAKPDLTSIVGALELGTVTVSAGATSTNGSGVTIANTVRQTVSRGADLPVASKAERDALTKWVGRAVKRLDDGGRVERWTGTAWAASGDVPVLASIAARDTYFTGNLRPGATALVAGNLHVYDGAGWRFTLTGVVSQATDANGLVTFAHNAGQGASSVQLTPVNSGDAVDQRIKLVVYSLIDPATVQVRAVRTDTSAYWGSTLITFYWSAKF